MKAWKDPWFRRATWTTIGLIGWVGLVSIGAMLASLEPPRAGDDLRVLVDAARRLLDGAPLYSTSAPSGSLVAESLFYSYPPPVAQALVPVAGLPLELLLVQLRTRAEHDGDLSAHPSSFPGLNPTRGPGG